LKQIMHLFSAINLLCESELIIKLNCVSSSNERIHFA